MDSKRDFTLALMRDQNLAKNLGLSQGNSTMLSSQEEIPKQTLY